jgi:hypothetical protein
MNILNIPASMFFRPYNEKLKIFEGLKVKRIKNSLTRCAKSGGIFHLWWHPHNFGDNLEQNICQLEEILRHFNSLRERYKLESFTMNDISKLVLQE